MIVPIVWTVFYVITPNFFFGVIGESTVSTSSHFFIVKRSTLRVSTTEAETLAKSFVVERSSIIISLYVMATCLVSNCAAR